MGLVRRYRRRHNPHLSTHLDQKCRIAAARRELPHSAQHGLGRDSVHDQQRDFCAARRAIAWRRIPCHRHSTAHGAHAPQLVGWLAGYVIAITLVLATLRFAWLFVSLRSVLFHGRVATNEPTATSALTLAVSPAGAPVRSGWRRVTVMSLAGVRGAVKLAGEAW